MHNPGFARLCALAVIGCALAALQACADDGGGSLATKSLPPDCEVDADCQSQLPDLGACTQAVCNEGSCAAIDREDGASCAEAACVAASSSDLRFVAAATCLAGSCAVAKAIPCAADVCEVASCDVVAGCQVAAVADGGGCDDGNACTALDSCSAGSCTHTALDCGDADPCTADSCAAATGCVHAPIAGCVVGADPCIQADGSKTNCDDGNPCTDDGCDAAEGCTHEAVSPDGSNPIPCDDGDVCTEGEGCKGGGCSGGKTKVCSDNAPCTQQTCDKIAGCQTSPSDGPCDDGDACTNGDVCTKGACAAGPVKSCDDGKLCTIDSCDAKLGCVHTPALGCNDCQGKASCTGASLPAFALLDQNKTSASHNQLVEPLAWKGKPILMISVDGYCPTCVVQASKLQALHNQLKQQGVDVAMFALNNKVYATQYAVSGACDFPVLNDTAAAGVYGLLAVPAKQYVYVWDAQGKLVSYFVPWEFSMSDDANVAKVGALLKALAL